MYRSKLTPFVRKQLVNCIEIGMPIGRAARAVGICHRTFDRWMNKGEHSNGDNDIYVQLVRDIEQAEANFIKKNVGRIDKGAEKNTEDAKWLLERRLPGEFGRRIELEVGPSRVLMALQEQARKALGKDTQREIATQALIAVADDVINETDNKETA